MNSETTLSLLRKILIAIFTALATKYHMDAQSPIWIALAADSADLIVIAWGMFSHWNMKKVPETAIAVQPIGTAPEDHPIIGEHVALESRGAGSIPAKVVGAILLALVMWPQFSHAQIANIRETVLADLAAARDDAKAHSDPSEACWALLHERASAMPVKIMGVAHGIQRARDLRRGLPQIIDACAIIGTGARQMITQIFALGAGGAAILAPFGL